MIFLYFGYLLGYIGPKTLLLSSNLPFVFINKFIINIKLAKDLNKRGVMELINLTFFFIFSSLSLIPKHNKNMQKIYYLSHLRYCSVNNYIAYEISFLLFTLLQKIFIKVLAAAKYTILIKLDIKDTF